MVRGKPLGADLKQLIITEHKEMGRPYQQISSNLGVARSTVHNVIKKFDESMAIDTKSKCGPPRKTNDDDDMSLKLVVKMNPNASLVDIKRKWETQIQKDISMTTFRRRFEELGIKLPQRPPFQTVREPEISIYAEEDKAPQRPESSLLEEQSLSYDAESLQENNFERHQEQQQQPRHKKTKKSTRRNKAKNSATIQATLESLQTVTKAISAHHDEFSLFGEYMAMSLRTMPMRNALRCKEKLLSVIVNERLNVGSEII